MLMLIMRRKSRTNSKQKQFERCVAAVENGREEELKPLSIKDYVRMTKYGKRVIYAPLSEKLQLLSYIMVVHEEKKSPTVQDVLNALEKAPAEIQEKTVAIEFHHGFYDFSATDFLELEEKGKWVSIVALLTREDTGRELPDVRLTCDKPIGMSDEDFERLMHKYPA